MVILFLLLALGFRYCDASTDVVSVDRSLLQQLVDRIEILEARDRKQQQQNVWIEKRDQEQQALIVRLLTRDREQQAKIDHLVTRDREQQARIDQLVTRDGKQQARIDELVTRDREQQAQIDQLVTRDREQQAQIDELVTRDREQQAQIDQLATRDREQQARTDELVIRDRKQQARIDQLATRDREQQARTDELVIRDREQEARIVQLLTRDRMLHTRVNEQHSQLAALRDELEKHEQRYDSLEKNAVRHTVKVKPGMPEERVERSRQGSEQIYPRGDQPQSIFRRQVAPASKVAFYAILTPEHVEHVGVNQDIVFDRVITNIGKAYNNHHGVFIAPVSGVYVFTPTVMGGNGRELTCVLSVNGHAMNNMYIRGTDNRNDQTSGTIIVHLNQGDDVSVKNSSPDTSLYGGGYTFFSGFLLYQD